MFVFKKKIAMFARPSYSEVRAASSPPEDWCAASRIALVDMRLASLSIVLEQSGTLERRDATGAEVRA